MFELTEQEKQELEHLRETFRQDIAQLKERMQKMRPQPEVDGGFLYENLNDQREMPPLADLDCDGTVQHQEEIHQAWVEAGSPQWQAVYRKYWQTIEEYGQKREAFYAQAEQRRLAQFQGNLSAILADAKKEVDKILISHSSKMYELFHWKVESSVLKFILEKMLSCHINALQNNTVLLQELRDYIQHALSACPYLLPSDNTSLAESKAQTYYEIIKHSYMAMYQSPVTNSFTRTSTAQRKNIQDDSEECQIIQGDLITFIQKHNQTPLKITASTHKLLKICTLALTSQNTYKSKKAPKTLVKIPLEQYMELCGMPLTASSKDYARKKVKKDLQVLFHISLEWNGPKGFSKMRLCGGVGIKNNIIMFDFYPPLARHLINAYVMQYPLDILKIDERNQYAYYVAEKLALHYSIDNNYLHSTHNIISFQALLEAIPGLPSYEEVAAKDRHIDLRIISPVQNALDSLDFITWYPCNKRKQPLTKEQLQNFDYHTFINTYVCFEILGYPEEKRQKRLESKKQKIEKAKSKKQKFISGKG